MQDANQLIKTNCATTTNRFKRNLYVPIYLSRLFLTSFLMSHLIKLSFLKWWFWCTIYIYVLVFIFLYILPCQSDSTLSDGNYEQNPRVLVIILTAHADNAAWWPTLWQLIQMLLHHWAIILILWRVLINLINWWVLPVTCGCVT